jgi:hypothetical protein
MGSVGWPAGPRSAVGICCCSTVRHEGTKSFYCTFVLQHNSIGAYFWASRRQAGGVCGVRHLRLSQYEPACAVRCGAVLDRLDCLVAKVFLDHFQLARRVKWLPVVLAWQGGVSVERGHGGSTWERFCRFDQGCSLSAAHFFALVRLRWRMLGPTVCM